MTTQTAVPLSELTGTYTFDPSHTAIGFVARHAMVTKVRGSFDEFDGTIRVDGDNPAGSSVSLKINAASVNTRNADRDGHLRSEDFFDAEQFPHLTFTSTAIEHLDDTHYRITGDLTIKGVSNPVTFDLEFTGSATDPFGNERLGFEGSVEVNRKSWDLTWNAALETGGVLVSEKATLEFEVSAIKVA